MSEPNAQSSLGPVQMLIVGFDGARFEGRILAELERLSEQGIVRLLDLLLVAKAQDGTLTALEASELGVEGAAELGAALGTLVGLDGAGAEPAEQPEEDPFDPEEVWYAADAIPPGSAAAIVLLEHRWAIPLREASQAAGGELLAEAWIHPLDLAAAGLGIE
jgi:hypothetical protein